MVSFDREGFPAPARAMLAAMLLAGAAAPAGSENPAPEDTARYHLNEVVVSVPRPNSTPGGGTAVEVSLDSLAIPPAPSLEEALEELPALQVRTNSRGEAELGTRGSGSRDVLLLLDGAPISLGWDGRTDASVIPASAPTRLRFLHGPSSMLYGPNALGGVVEVDVGRSAGRGAGSREASSSSLQLEGGYDASEGHRLAAAVTTGGEHGSGGRWILRFGAGHRDSPGVPLASGVSEPIPAANEDLRLNTDVEQTDGFATFHWSDRDGAWGSLSALSFQAERGIAAQLGVADDDARFWRYPHIARTLLVASGGTGLANSPLGGQGELRASLGHDRGESEIEQYGSRAYDTVTGFEDGKDRTNTFRLEADQSFGIGGLVRTAFTWVGVRHDEFLPAGASRYRQNLWSAAGEMSREFARRGDWGLRANLGAAWDGADTPESGGKPSFGQLDDWGGRLAISAVSERHGTVAHASVARRARFPSLRELYSGALGTFEPNPALRPERLLAYETGISAPMAGGHLQAVLFHHRLKDVVVRTRTPASTFKRVNRDRLTSTGLELIGTRRIGRVALEADVVVQTVELENTASGSAGEPENLPEVAGTLRLSAPVAAGWRVGAEAEYTGDQFAIDPAADADTELNGRTVYAVRLGRTWTLRGDGAAWWSRLETQLAVENARDTAVYDQFGLPRPGRLLRVEARLR